METNIRETFLNLFGHSSPILFVIKLPIWVALQVLVVTWCRLWILFQIPPGNTCFLEACWFCRSNIFSHLCAVVSTWRTCAIFHGFSSLQVLCYSDTSRLALNLCASYSAFAQPPLQVHWPPCSFLPQSPGSWFQELSPLPPITLTLYHWFGLSLWEVPRGNHRIGKERSQSRGNHSFLFFTCFNFVF